MILFRFMGCFLRLTRAFFISLLALTLISCGMPQALDGAASETEDDEVVSASPVISTIDPQSVDEDDVLSDVEITIEDEDSDLACDTSFSAGTSNSTKVNRNNIVFSGTAPDCLMTITPEADAYGDVEIYLTVSDGANRTYSNFTLTINPINDAPTISDIDDASTEVNTLANIIFSVTDSDSEFTCDDTMLSATSSNAFIVDNAAIAFSAINSEDLPEGFPASLGGATYCVISLMPMPDSTGVTTIEITANDGEATSSTSFDLTVTP